MVKPVRYSLFLILVSVVLVAMGILLFDILTKNVAYFSLIKLVILVVIAIIIGCIISIVASATVPYFKELLLSARSLVRFESLSHPLLIKLSMEAPGTYHHSLTVANLAYGAAKAIGADAILTRVGSYYHDIGKLSQPAAFIENQKDPLDLVKTNNHSKSQLKKSAQMIIDHVSYGLKLAREYGLPKEITAFIPEHQGTTYVRFFLQEAKKSNRRLSLRDFRYPGPTPLSRETAIVMLADAIEAKVRLVPRLDQEEIIGTVDEVIADRLQEKQLDLAGLTDIDLRKIRNSFINTLSTIHHQRINYPDSK